ncbi:MAG: hypothetical protein SNJ75_04410 [Gemmataceae bacterium]
MFSATNPNAEPSAAELPDRPLTLPILVAGWSLPLSVRTLLWLASAVVLLILCGRFLRGDRFEPWQWLWLTLPFGMVGLFLLGWRRSTWLEIGREGFSLRRANGEHCYFRDDQVGEITWQRRASFDFGSDAERYDIHLVVHLTQGLRQLRWRYRNRPEAPLALDAFLRRLINNLATRTLAQLPQGGRLDGDNWHLDAQGLHYRGQVMPLSRLSVWGVLYGRLRIYLDDQAEPWATLPAQRRNVYVLERVLAIAGKPTSTTEQSLRGHLGRHLHSLISRDWIHLLTTWPFAGLSLFLATGAYFNGWKMWGFHLGATIFALGALWCFWLGVYSILSRLELYERGVTQPRRGRTLRYDQLAAVQANRSLSRLTLHPRDSSQTPIRFWATAAPGHRDNLLLLRLMVQPLASQWLQQLRTAGLLPWTGRLIFHHNGLEVLSAPWLGSPTGQRVPYASVAMVEQPYQVHFFEVASQRVLGSERYHTPNFFVGWLLLEWLSQRPDWITSSELTQTALPVELDQRSQHVQPAEHR